MKGLLTLLIGIIFPVFAYSQELPPPVIYEQAGPDDNGSEETSGDEIIFFPDVEAQFKGGTNAFQQYIGINVNYPAPAIEHNIQGKVFVSFIVEKNGKITNVQVFKGVHPALDAEAIRVISKMPKWKPGKVGKKKVRTRCMVPINFVLE